MEAVSSFETSGYPQTTWCCNPENCVLNNRHHENLLTIIYRYLESWVLIVLLLDVRAKLPGLCVIPSFMHFIFSQERTVKNFSQVDAEFGRKLTEGLRKHAKSNIIASANL
jgi:hypothetical protein